MAIEAAKAGKDIWCEKPMTRTIGEGIRVVQAVQQYGRIFRINTWFRFKDPFYAFGSTVAPLKKLADSGLLGWPLKITLSATTGFDWKFYWSGKTKLIPQTIPAHLDYDFWLGPAPYKPYCKNRPQPQCWRQIDDYAAGTLTDWGMHLCDTAQVANFSENSSPVKVEGTGVIPQNAMNSTPNRFNLT